MMNAVTTMSVELDENHCWKAVLGRDASQDGKFYYGVMTTGVFCRPSCAARRPKRENVRFYATADEAERDGLRPCRRCHPRTLVGSDPSTTRIRELCHYIEQHADERLTLAELAKRAKLSPFHLQRAFKEIVGVSPKAYQDWARMESFKSLLRSKKNHDVTDAIFQAGFGSLSRLYEKADTRLGMTPMEYRDGGRGVEITYGSVRTPLGLMMVGATDRGLCFVQFGERVGGLLQALKAHYPKAAIRPLSDPTPVEFAAWMAGLNRYLAGQQPDLRLPVHVRATSFQLMVWKYLQTIPRGSVESYREVAKAIGRPAAARAVARACASNPVAMVIPCHRVIRGTGELGGYRWGLERKRTLLDKERETRSGRP